jgi:HAD superfamily hydrolase (TIGR01509 family)
MPEAVIFDIDGTLINSVDLHARAWHAAFIHFGKDLPYLTVREQIGKGSDQLLETLLTPDERRRFGKELQSFRDTLYERDYLPRARPFPLVRELFQRLRSDGVRIAVASSAPEEEVHRYLTLAEIADLVDVKTSKDDVERSKPAPDLFAFALKQLGDLEGGRAIVVGDAPWDALAATKLGLPTIGVLSGGFSASTLRAAGCIALFEDPADMLLRYSTWQPRPVRRAGDEAGAGSPR